MTVAKTFGYAIKSRLGGIDAKTVFDTKRGAVVNWLCSNARVSVTNNDSDDAIFQAFRTLAGPAGATCVKVWIAEIADD